MKALFICTVLLASSVANAQAPRSYFYHLDAGWTYIFENTLVDNISGGPQIRRGGNDTLRTMGFRGMSPTGDSIYAYSLSYRYRVTTDTTMYLVSNSQFSGQNGAYSFKATSGGSSSYFSFAPRPIAATSTDTILASCAAGVCWLVHWDDWTGLDTTLTYRADTIYFSIKNNMWNGDVVMLSEGPIFDSTQPKRTILTQHMFTDELPWNFTPDGEWRRMLQTNSVVASSAGIIQNAVLLEQYNAIQSFLAPGSHIIWYAPNVGEVEL